MGRPSGPATVPRPLNSHRQPGWRSAPDIHHGTRAFTGLNPWPTSTDSCGAGTSVPADNVTESCGAGTSVPAGSLTDCRGRTFSSGGQAWPIRVEADLQFRRAAHARDSHLESHTPMTQCRVVWERTHRVEASAPRVCNRRLLDARRCGTCRAAADWSDPRRAREAAGD